MVKHLDKVMVLLSRTIVSVHYDVSEIRLLEFRRDRSGSVKIRGKFSERIPADLAVSDAESFGGYLSDLLKRSGMKSRWISFAVSRESALLHHLAVPPTPEEELANLVRFRISQELPFAIEESVVDYVITSRDDASLATGVLACAVKLEQIDHLRHAARFAGLRIRRIGLAPYAHLLACDAAGHLAGGVTLFVNLSGDAIEFDVFNRAGEILFSRSVGVPADTSGAELLDEALLQLQRTMPAYNAEERSEALAQVVVDGDTGEEDEFARKAGEQLQIPGRRFALPGSTDQGGDPGFSTCYGLAAGQFRRRGDQFDFLFPKRSIDPAARRAKRIQLAVGAVALLMIVSIGYSKIAEGNKQRERAAIKADLDDVKARLKDLNKFRAQVKGLQRWRDQRTNWLDQLNTLTELMPETKDAYLTSIKFIEIHKKQKKQEKVFPEIKIGGRARSAKTVDEITAKLKKEGRYDVGTGPVRRSGRVEEYPWEFSMPLRGIAAGNGSSKSGQGKKKEGKETGSG